MLRYRESNYELSDCFGRVKWNLDDFTEYIMRPSSSGS